MTSSSQRWGTSGHPGVDFGAPAQRPNNIFQTSTRMGAKRTGSSSKFRWIDTKNQHLHYWMEVRI